MLVKLDIASALVFDYCIIIIQGQPCLIDPEDYDRISAYKWYLKRTKYKFYAVRKKRGPGKEFLIYMHRQITHCPNRLVVHHLNHCSLDNRKANLELMTRKAHDLIHRFY